jgi:chromosome segregation ATPase
MQAEIGTTRCFFSLPLGCGEDAGGPSPGRYGRVPVAARDSHGFCALHRKEQPELNLFQKELERLKNENLSPLLPRDINLIDPSLSGLERTLSQLDTANEHLQSIFPSFKELPGSGNALERVLALELELAEALQAKKKTDILFQSSFLKQHNDEAAVFQSFRDINELIQDTIELKKRQVAVESELKEMQGRYSELSVQFAEVEGERQKLEMNLKNQSPWKS